MSIVRSKSLRGRSENYKIAIAGDSMSADNYAWTFMWGTILQSVLRQNGIACEVRSFSINAHDFYRANVTNVYGEQTLRQAVIDYDPDVVLAAIGINSVVDPIESRTFEQAKADALEFFQYIRTKLPRSKIYFGNHSPWDIDNFPNPATTLKNKGLPPKLMDLDSSGLMSGLIYDGMLENSASSGYKTEMENFRQLVEYISALDEIDGVFSMRGWKLTRLGLLGPDRYHFRHAAEYLIVSSILKDLIAIGADFLSNLSDQLIPGWSDIETIFSEYLTDSGDGYTASSGNSESADGTAAALGFPFRPVSWFKEYKSQARFYPLALANDSTILGQFRWSIKGAKPLTEVENAMTAVGDITTIIFSWVSTGVTTDEDGNAETAGVIGPLGLANGSYDYYFKVSKDVIGPFTVTLS